MWGTWGCGGGLITLVDVLGQLRVCFHKEWLTTLLRDVNQILSMLREFWWTGLHEILIAWLHSLEKRFHEVLEHNPLSKLKPVKLLGKPVPSLFLHSH
jgi:hypothetical protein